MDDRIGVALIVATGSLLAVVAVSLTSSIAAAGDLGIDHGFYVGVGQRWLTDGTYYLPHQLAGPYAVTLMRDVLYPPAALLLLVPAAILPAPVWWLVPMAVAGYVIADWRPSPWAIAGMLLLLAWPRAAAAYLYGNTDMWAMAGVAAGLRWGWPAVLVLLKPTLAPLALVGIRSRGWWLALGVLGVVSLPLAGEYVTAMVNLRADPAYSLGSIPLLLVPVVGWLSGRTRVPRGGTPPAGSSGG